MNRIARVVMEENLLERSISIIEENYEDIYCQRAKHRIKSKLFIKVDFYLFSESLSLILVLFVLEPKNKSG